MLTAHAAATATQEDCPAMPKNPAPAPAPPEPDVPAVASAPMLPDPSKPIPADALIPARYLGDSPVYLSRPQSAGRRFYAADGTPLEPKRIEVQVPNARGRLRGGTGSFGKPRTITQVVYALGPGDTLMLPASEVLGVTYLHPHDSNAETSDARLPSYVLGAGWRPLPEHAAAGLDWSADLRDQPFVPQSGPAEVRAALWVYDYHGGRSDFAPLAPYDDPALVPAAFRRPAPPIGDAVPVPDSSSSAVPASAAPALNGGDGAVQ